MPVYPKTANIQVKSKPVNTKPRSQLSARPPPRDARPVMNMMPYHPAKQSMKRYKK